MIIGRWKGYFDKLLNEENPRSIFGDGVPNEGLTQGISRNVIPIYKEKGDIQDCGNYRGIKLMSHTITIWERIIDRRLREETTIGDEQFGFMPGRGTTDAIFAVRQLMEKRRGKQKGLHIKFIDLEKAYDRVPRQEVWRCTREKGVPEKYVMIVQDMYEGSRTRIKSSVQDPSGSRVTPRIFPGPLPFRHDYGCVGPRDKGSIPMVHVIC